MFSTRSFLCLTLLLAGAAAAFARVIPIQERATPLALRPVPAAVRYPGNPFDDYPNFRINSDNSGQVQNEEQSCISPIDSNVFVAVWRDFRFGYRRVGVGYSHDAGETWTDNVFPQMYEEWQSDPTLVVDAEGVFTANIITFPQSQVRSQLIQISSYDGGVTWQDTVWAAHNLLPPGFEDKQMLAVDVSNSQYRGTFYCPWTRFYNYSQGTDSIKIQVVCKRPDSLYRAPVILSTDWSVQWSNVCVGPDGEVYVNWVAYEYLTDSVFIKISRSLDGGVTWSPEHRVVSPRFFSADITPQLLIFSYGAMACDMSDGPYRGRLYMVFTDMTPNQAETDVWLVYSDDQGETWSARQTICDEPQTYPIDQFHPWISVDEAGRVWTVFYDRRNDQENLLMDTYFTVSTDGGDTWRPNERISTESSDPGAGVLLAGLIGEYIGWQARGGNALAVWTDTRLGNQDVYSALIDSLFIGEAADNPHAAVPNTLSISAYPNPTNGSANIRYALSQPGTAGLVLYDVMGRLVREVNLGEKTAGNHQTNVTLDGLATGIYFAELKTANEAVRTKLMLLK